MKGNFSSTFLHLDELGAQYLEPTQQKNRNVMRILKPGEKIQRARAVCFRCPRCGPSHNIVSIFNFPQTPANLLPRARFSVYKFPCTLKELTLLEEMHMNCGVSGYVAGGKFYFKMRSDG